MKHWQSFGPPSPLASCITAYRISTRQPSRLTVPRAFTQEISRYVFDRSVGGIRQWNGIGYRSRHGDDLENCAIFEPTSLSARDIA